MKQIVAMRDDIAFYIKLYPLMSIHPQSYEKSLAIMCEEDNDKALKLLEDAFDKKPLPEASCKSGVVDEHLRLGRSLDISGTPAMVFQNGRKVSGALQANELAKLATEEGSTKNKK